MSNRAFPSMTALLALLAVAGYQNRDKITEMIKGATQGARPGQSGAPDRLSPPSQPVLPDELGQTQGGAAGGGLGGGVGGGLGGGLGGLLGGLGGLLGGAASGNVLQNGLSELLERFRQNGHDEADSWVATGENRQIDDRNLEHAIGPDVLQTLSEQTGLSREELLARLSRTLPEAVDKYTPNGRLEAA